MQSDILSGRRSFIGTYWPDFILLTTLADSGGRAEDRTAGWFPPLAGGRSDACRSPEDRVVEAVAIGVGWIAPDRVGG